MESTLDTVSASPVRCGWATTPLMLHYHDEEWGVPTYDDRTLFEFLCLEGAQAGLSWATILGKRQRYREVFDNFDPARIAMYGPNKTVLLVDDPGIVRNPAKIQAIIQNAHATLRIKKEFGSLSRFLWQFVDHTPKQNAWKTLAEVPTATPTADLMSKTLKKRGFTFVGATICYAFMQATGMVNDHLVSCYRYTQIASQASKQSGERENA